MDWSRLRLVLGWSGAIAPVMVGTVQAAPIGGQVAQACYQHYLGSTDSDSFYKAPMRTREHVLDCMELLTKTGHMPTDARVSALSRNYDAAEEADNRAYEDQLTRKLGHKPTLDDYKTELTQSLERLAGAPQTSGPLTLPHSAASDAAVSAAHSAILATLKDPNSAKFDARDGEAYSLNTDGTLYAVCGTVDAKNSFGGYAGGQLWIYVLAENTIYTQETGATTAMATRDCTGSVHRPSRKRSG